MIFGWQNSQEILRFASFDKLHTSNSRDKTVTIIQSSSSAKNLSQSPNMSRRTFCLKKVDDTLKKIFFSLGVSVGRRPGYFLIVPTLLTALCASGFQRLVYNYDPEYLISPSSGPAKNERAIMEKYFPVNYDYFQVGFCKMLISNDF